MVAQTTKVMVAQEQRRPWRPVSRCGGVSPGRLSAVTSSYDARHQERDLGSGKVNAINPAGTVRQFVNEDRGIGARKSGGSKGE